MNAAIISVESSVDGAVRNWDVAEFPVSVGRDASCTISLDDNQVSRRHLELEMDLEGVLVRDLSSNGTLADGQVLCKSELKIAFGRPILLGKHTLRVRPIDGWDEVDVQPSDQDATLPPFVPGFEADALSPEVVPEKASRPTIIATSPPSKSHAEKAAQESDASLRREIHKRVVEYLDLATLGAKRLDDPSFRPRVLTALRRIIRSMDSRIPARMDRDRLVGEMADEALGLGPLEHLLADGEISEIMVVDATTIYVEKSGKIVRSDARFTDDDRVRAVIERIVTPLGRRIDESSPLVDARLKDGSRVNAIISPLALKGSCITIRKFAKKPLTMQDLLSFGTLSQAMSQFLTRSVAAKKNIVISGGTGSGKTTLLNVLSAAIPSAERIVTIEDSAELQLGQPHVVSLETRPPNMEGKGEYNIRDLVRNALRMRPDRIVVGECRGGEALDMLQAMNTGHDGSLTTTHANSPAEALGRLETLCLMAGLDLPARAIREQIAGSVHLIVQQSRLSDGTRRVTAVSELGALRKNGDFLLRDIYRFTRTGVGERGNVEGRFVATGYLPSYLDELLVRGLIPKGEAYV